MISEEAPRVVGLEHRPGLVSAGEEHGGKDASDSGAGGNVEVIGDSGVGIARFELERVLEIREGLSRENPPHASAAVDAEYADFAPLVLDCRNGGFGLGLGFEFGVGGGRGRRDLLGDPEFLIVVAEEELALQYGEYLVAELIGVDARLLHFGPSRSHLFPPNTKFRPPNTNTHTETQSSLGFDNIHENTKMLIYRLDKRNFNSHFSLRERKRGKERNGVVLEVSLFSYDRARHQSQLNAQRGVA